MSDHVVNSPDAPASGTITERYVFIFGFTAQEQVDSLREATGMLPGDMGQWKGNDRLVIDGEHVGAAIAWARAEGRTYEVSTTVRCEPQQTAVPVPDDAVPGVHITVHTAGSDGRSHYAVIDGELIEAVDELPNGTPDWDNGGICDAFRGDPDFVQPAIALLTHLGDMREAYAG